MFEYSENLNDINLQGGSTKNIIESIKGGFPRIKICDSEIIKKILEKKPKEFSNKNIMSIKDMIKIKKSDAIIDLIIEPNIFINKSKDTSILNIIKEDNEITKINNISIDLIIGNTKKNK